ncbi:flippase [Nesterenkonia alba]|uniref:flippase n=1 Tax=Nesterenkonia alba TaxID=515814 RepID=UPI0004034BC3|nr:flippase [Nesterenkonia alba]
MSSSPNAQLTPEAAGSGSTASDVGKEHKRRAVGSGLWNVLHAGGTTGLNTLFGVLLIIGLPPSEVGIYNYAGGVVALGAAMMTTGFDSFVVRRILQDEQKAPQVLASALVLREALAAFALMMAIGLVLTSGSLTVAMAAVVMTSALFLRALETPSLWFLAHLRSRTPTIVVVSASAVLFCVKVISLFTFGELWILIALFVLEAGVCGVSICLTYRRVSGLPFFVSPSWADIRHMLKEAWPLMVAGGADQFASKVGMFFLQAVHGSAYVAVYSAAVRFTELAAMLPVVFMTSTLPLLVKFSQGDSGVYQRYLQKSYDRAFWLGVLAGLLLWVAGSIVITVIFGDDYRESITVLAITSCGAPFLFMGAIYTKWTVTEGHYRVLLTRYFCGAVAATTVAFLVVDRWGPVGAGVAWLSAIVVGTYLSTLVDRRSWKAAGQMSKAFVWPIRVTIAFLRDRLSKQG